MKKAMVAMLLCLAFAFSVFAGVTEIKIYTNESGPRYYQDNLAKPGQAANYIGQSKDRIHTNGIVARLGMNADVDTRVTPPDSCQLWATKEAAAAGPYGLKVHFVTMPNPRLWIDIMRTDTPGYTNHLDASATQRVTFWIKAAPGSYPLYFRIRSANSTVDGKDVYGAHICLQGETVVRMDAFGYPAIGSITPWNGEWQFVSLPWEFIRMSDVVELQKICPYSWAGHKEGEHYYGEWFDPSAIRWLSLDTADGGQADRGAYPWPKDPADPTKNLQISGDYMVDEIVFTMNEGSGVTDVEGKANIMPLAYNLGNAYPNPFNPSTSINYSLPVSNNVTVTVYNSLGMKVRTLVNEMKSAGTYQASWDGKDEQGMTMASGVYFVRMQASHYSSVQKMLLTK